MTPSADPSESVVTTVINVNGTPHAVSSGPGTPLLYVLRNELGLKGTRFGCGEGTCGACTVLIDGVPRHSCDTPIEYVGDEPITTVEGLAVGSAQSPLQQAFVDEQAAQCGFCSSGILIRAQALLDQTPNPTDGEIREALDTHLCRCGVHARVIRAVSKAAADGGDGHRLTIESPSTAPGTALDEEGIGNDYLSVQPDGTVLVTSGKVDLGQGISTALSQIAAAELQVGIARIRIIGADTAISPDEGNTSASISVQQGGGNLRTAAGALRIRLLELAAERLGAERASLRTTDGAIAAPDGRSITYWELAGGPPEPQVSADTAASAGVVGESTPRWDLPRKFRGEPSFVHDLELPEMLHGRILRPPSGNARLTSLDTAPAAGAPGVVKVVETGRFLAVIAQEEYQAIEAAKQLQAGAAWDASATTRDLADPRHLLSEDTQTETAHSKQQEGPADRSRSFAATFTRPFLAHGSIGPSCAVALHDGSSLTVWSHTQGVFPLRSEMAKVLEIPETAVRVIHMEGAGCYGHNGADDCAFDAALLALEVPGRPVRVQWSREDEFLWEPYGSAMTVELEASLDDDNNIIEWGADVWSYVHSARPAAPGTRFLAEAHRDSSPFPQRSPLPTESAVRNALPLYAVPSVAIRGHLAPDGLVRTSALRSLGAHANVFAIESLIDEMADAIGESPVDFRLRHLQDPRAREVVRAAVTLAGGPIGGTNKEGHGFGLGFARYKNESGYAAVVAEIEAETEVRVHNIWAVVDAGMIVNPDGAINQIEGGVIQSASWALKESVPFEAGRPNAHDWHDYPILTFSEIPDVEVELINRPDMPSVGVGEVVQGPTTAAIANGLRAVLGVPIRDLPFTRDRVMKALLQ